MNSRPGMGVTLVEMLVVVGIIVLLAGIVVSLTWRVDNQSKERALGNVFALLKSALQEYYEFNDAFPDQPERDFSKAVAHAEFLYAKLDSVPASRQVLRQINQALVKGSREPPVPMKIYDPWGTVIDYRYVSTTDTFPEMISAGPDKKFETVDDISSKNM